MSYLPSNLLSSGFKIKIKRGLGFAEKGISLVQPPNRSETQSILVIQTKFNKGPNSVCLPKSSIKGNNIISWLYNQLLAMSKSKKKQRSTEECERVSSLPDSTICHILSFLPTKDTIATSILSKRWNPLWLSVFTLDFIDEYNTLAPLFRRAHSGMLSRDNTLPIRSFRLKCCFRYDQPNDITQLIIAAIQRQTQTLELSMNFYPLDTKIASNIFTCRTLTVLKLNKIIIGDDIPQINNNNNTISRLKTLHLDRVHFMTRTHIIDFLFSFPILEELLANDLFIMEELLVKHHPWNKQVVPIKADKIKCLPNLVTAKLYDNEPIPLFLLSTAVSLSIKMTWTHYVQVPIFYNLTRMELFSNLEDKTWPKKWSWMLEMLQHSPNLQHLIIYEEEFENRNDDDDIWEDPKIVPECLSSKLKTCLFKNYRGKKCELQFADYVMRSSKVLTHMTIRCACSTDLNAKYQMLQKLSLCLRGCKLIFK